MQCSASAVPHAVPMQCPMQCTDLLVHNEREETEVVLLVGVRELAQKHLEHDQPEGPGGWQR